MTLEEWEARAPAALRAQPLWRVAAYRRAAHLAALAADDVVPLARDFRFPDAARQLIRAIGSIGANIAEGYARRSRAERIRFYEYAFGSTNESTHWLLTVTARLGEDVVDERIDQLSHVRRLLLTMIKNERQGGRWNVSRRMPPPNDIPRGR